MLPPWQGVRLAIEELTNQDSSTVELKGSDLACFVDFGAIATVISFYWKDVVVDFDGGSIFPVVFSTSFDGENTNGMVTDRTTGGSSVARGEGPEEGKEDERKSEEERREEVGHGKK